TCSTGGASPGLNTLVVLETGRLRKPWSGGAVTRGGPKNGSTIGGGETAGAAGREGSGDAITEDPCGDFRLGFVPSSVPPSGDAFAAGLSAKIWVKEPAGGVTSCADPGVRDSGCPPGPNTRVKSPGRSLAGSTLAKSGTPGEVCGVPGVSKGSRKKL